MRFLFFFALAAQMTVFAAKADTYTFPSLPRHSCEFITCADKSQGDGSGIVEPIRLRGGDILNIDDPSVNTNIAKRLYPVMRTYPNLESCISNENPESEKLIDAKVDWSRIKSDNGASVCLFRLFDAMRDPEIVADWMATNGFINVKIAHTGRTSSFVYTDKYHDYNFKDINLVSSFWPSSEKGALYGSIIAKFLTQIASRGTFLNVAFDKRGDVLMVDVGSMSKLIK